MINGNLPLSIQEALQAVEVEIEQLSASPVALAQKVTRYVTTCGGKRLRPCVTLLSAEAAGGLNKDVVALASLVELTHTATLIHDDVVDESHTRRGQPSVNRLWGNTAAVLVGDHLFTQVMLVLASEQLSPYLLTLARATNRMCAGELLEIELKKNAAISETQYFQLIRDKTAELLGAACQLGAMSAKGGKTAIHALREFGIQLGLAFQIIDDVLDLVADGAKLGKPVGSDLRGGKITLPYIRTLAVATPGNRAILEKIVTLPVLDDSAVEEALAIAHRYDGVEYSRAAAKESVRAAQRAIEMLPKTGAKDLLHTVAAFVVERDY